MDQDQNNSTQTTDTDLQNLLVEATKISEESDATIKGSSATLDGLEAEVGASITSVNESLAALDAIDKATEKKMDALIAEELASE